MSRDRQAYDLLVGHEDKPRFLRLYEAIAVRRAFTMFLALILAFILGFALIGSGNPHGWTAFRASILLTVTLIAAYWALGACLAWGGAPSAEPRSGLRRQVFWIMFALGILGILSLFVFAPTTASVELFKHLIWPGYQMAYSDIEVRLSTAAMPVWAQVAFEMARRFAIPYCMLEFFLTPTITERRREIGIALAIALVVSVFSTLDRAIPVLYFAMVIAGMFLHTGLGALKSRYFYLCFAGIVAVVALFKNIQYGEFRSVQFSQNTDIARSLSRPARPDEEATRSAKKPENTDGPSLKAEKPRESGSASIEMKPSPASSANPADSASPASESNPASSTPTSSPADPVEAAAPQTETPAALLGTPTTPKPQATDYIGYVGSSLIERVLLSPMAMTLYAVESYDEHNFQHWSTTRLFSFLHLSRYVNPLEKGTQKYHDAFPVTFVGDLWRNGGYRYFPVYAVLLGAVLFFLDRRTLATSTPVSLRVLAVFGVLYLFYGNAFNATSCLMIGGSIVLTELFRRTT